MFFEVLNFHSSIAQSQKGKKRRIKNYLDKNYVYSHFFRSIFIELKDKVMFTVYTCLDISLKVDPKM